MTTRRIGRKQRGSSPGAAPSGARPVPRPVVRRDRWLLGCLILVLSGAAQAATAPSTEPLLTECAHQEALVFPRARVQAVAGRVLDGASESEAPLAGVQIELRGRRGQGALYVLSGADGEFSFGAVPEGAYTLRTCLGGRDAVEVEIDLRRSAESLRCELVLVPSQARGAPEVRWLKR